MVILMISVSRMMLVNIKLWFFVVESLVVGWVLLLLVFVMILFYLFRCGLMIVLVM